MAQVEKEEAVQAGQLEQLLAFNTKAVFSNSLLVFLLAFMLVEVLPLLVITGWVVCLLIMNSIQLAIGLRFSREPVTSPDLVSQRLRIIRLGAILRAAAWGSLILLVHGEGQVEHQVFIAYVFVGLSAGAAMIYSIDLVNALAYLILAVVPLVLSFAFGDDITTFVVSMSAAFYVVFMTISVRTSNRSLVEGIVLRQEALNSAEEIKQLAFYDVITGLPNRRLLLDRLKHSLLRAERAGKRGALLFLDLDNFKKINDSLGHDKGDELLVQVAQRLQQSVRETDTVSRFGGDEFVVILENLHENYQTALEEVNRISGLIQSNLQRPYKLDGIEHNSTSSMGVALYGEHGDTPGELLKNADVAMYHVKDTGRNAVCVFDQSMVEEEPE